MAIRRMPAYLESCCTASVNCPDSSGESWDPLELEAVSRQFAVQAVSDAMSWEQVATDGGIKKVVYVVDVDVDLEVGKHSDTRGSTVPSSYKGL